MSGYKNKTWLDIEIEKVKNVARQTVARALANGSLKRQKCIRQGCELIGHAHHRNYYKPLQITWLCHKHHQEVHGKKAHTDRLIKIPDNKEYARLYYASRSRKIAALEGREMRPYKQRGERMKSKRKSLSLNS